MTHRCREVLQKAYLYLDHEGLSEQERGEIELHLQQCFPCYRRYGLEREVTHLIGRLGQQPCPDGVRARVVSFLKQV